MQNKRGFGKIWHFFYLKPTILDVWDMSNGFMTNWVTPWLLWLSKNCSVEIMGRYNRFLSFKSEYSKYPICSFFLACYTATAPIIFMNIFIKYAIKVVRKVSNTDQII